MMLDYSEFWRAKHGACVQQCPASRPRLWQPQILLFLAPIGP